jgi:hypothetical protein
VSNAMSTCCAVGCSRGTPGGPLTDEFGEVTGVVFASGMQDDDIAYALTVEEITDARAASGAAIEPVPNGSCELR